MCPLWIESKTDLFMDRSGGHCGEDILELRSHIRRHSVLLCEASSSGKSPGNSTSGIGFWAEEVDGRSSSSSDSIA